jgi:hypothetical protein
MEDDGSAVALDARRPPARDRRDERTERHRREQQAVEHGAASEPLGQGREQRPRHPEHHRQQVDPERAHDHGLAAKEPQAFEDRGPRRPALTRRRRRRQPGEDDDRDQVRADIDPVGDAEPRCRDQQTAERRPRHHPERAVRRLQRERGRTQRRIEQ